MNKEFVKLTTEQFRAFIDKLPEFQRMAAELKREMESLPAEKWDKTLGKDFSWAWVYELPFVTHVAVVMYAINLVDWLKEVAASPDPQQRILDDQHETHSGDFHPDVEDHIGIGLIVSLVRTLQSITMYGRSLSALIHDVRESDDLDSLFKAIKVDRSIVNCPTIADRIAKAELRNEKRFFIRLSNAFKGPSNKEWAGLAKMRLSFHLLRELEQNDLSDDQLEHLMVHVLDAYKDVPGARKNLRAQYQNFRNFKTI